MIPAWYMGMDVINWGDNLVLIYILIIYIFTVILIKLYKLCTYK
jgi:hypothetical protein